MSDFLTRLIERQWGQIPTVQPRMPSVFAPVTDQAGSETADVVAISQPPPTRERKPAAMMEEPRVQGPPTSPAAPPAAQVLVPTVEQQPVSQKLLGESESRESLAAVPSVQAPVVGGRKARQVAIPTPLVPPASESRHTREVAVRAQPEPRPSERESAGERPGVAASSTTRTDPPPRLVEQSAQDQARTRQQVSAPVSLVVPGTSPGHYQKDPQDVVEPPVQVTIGRIEVTAVIAPSTPKRAPPARKPSMSLQDYLARRQGKAR